jgi:hypothetical protein
MAFQTFAHNLRINSTTYHSKMQTMQEQRHRIIDLFFKQYVEDHIKQVLLTVSTQGISWGYLHKYKKHHFAYITGPFNEPYIAISPIWVKDSMPLHEIIYSDIYRQKKLSLEYSLSDSLTTIRIQHSNHIDNLNQYNGIWVEFIHTTPLATHTPPNPFTKSYNEVV